MDMINLELIKVKKINIENKLYTQEERDDIVLDDDIFIIENEEASDSIKNIFSKIMYKSNNFDYDKIGKLFKNTENKIHICFEEVYNYTNKRSIPFANDDEVIFINEDKIDNYYTESNEIEYIAEYINEDLLYFKHIDQNWIYKWFSKNMKEYKEHKNKKYYILTENVLNKLIEDIKSFLKKPLKNYSILYIENENFDYNAIRDLKLQLEKIVSETNFEEEFIIL